MVLGKTSSVMEPFLKQLISQDSPKLGMLILDVKGNFYKAVKKYAKEYDRLDSLIIIELGSNIKYNPLNKPNLKPSVLANRLKTILELFSSNNSDSYWLDKSEQVITEAIKLCRLYNNGYVTFVELHNLINYDDYFQTKIEFLRKAFQSGTLSREKIYDLYSSLNFFENEFRRLDSRTLSIIKSEITRITNTFISDYDVLNTFCPKEDEINFCGFESLIKENKIVVLNMNIAKYKNLSKIIAAYLKLDFQSEVLIQLSNKKSISPTVFMCDEYHEYVTLSDSDFFAQSREAKCINIVATQSYTSLLNTLKDESSVKVILQNLVNKIWLRTDDIFTIESAQKQIGREDKIKYSRNISENAGETNYNYFINSLESKKSNISESISTQIHTDFVYDTNFFTQKLKTFSCLAFLSDGTQILPPCKVDLFPSFLDITDKKISSSNKIIYKGDLMKKNCLFIFYFIFVIFLTLIFLPTDAFAAYPKLVTKIVKGFETIESWILKASTPAAAVAVGTGVFMKKFSFGDEERIRLGKKVIRGSLFSYAFILAIDLILSTIQVLVA